jgi:hypothetical protein
MSMPGRDEVEVKERRPRGCKSAPWARSVEHQDAGAWGKSELLVSAMQVFVGTEIQPNGSDAKPHEEPNQLGSDLKLLVWLKELHQTPQ